MTIMSKTKLKMKKDLSSGEIEEKNHIKKTHHKAKKRFGFCIYEC